MTDELPEIFDRLKLQPAPPELRPRVLAAVERELTRHKKPRWERALELGVAATLLLGIGLNVWQWRADGSWRDSVDRPQPAIGDRQKLLEAMASVTDEATARLLIDGLVVSRARPHRAMPGDAKSSVKN